MPTLDPRLEACEVQTPTRKNPKQLYPQTPTPPQVEAQQAALMHAIRERYNGEQAWGDKIRRSSTWWGVGWGVGREGWGVCLWRGGGWGGEREKNGNSSELRGVLCLLLRDGEGGCDVCMASHVGHVIPMPARNIACCFMRVFSFCLLSCLSSLLLCSQQPRTLPLRTYAPQHRPYPSLSRHLSPLNPGP